MPTVFEQPTDLLDAEGTDLGHTDWLEVDQARVDRFAAATGDDQWIHVDPERAAAESPYGGTIAHGYLTMALSNYFLPQLLEVRNVSMGVNYGVDKVRFPAPVPVGSRVRANAVITDVTEVKDTIQTTITITMEVEHGDRPACVIESISRWR